MPSKTKLNEKYGKLITQRIAQAEKAITQYRRPHHIQDPHNMYVLLIADVLHHASCFGCNPVEITRTALGHFVSEHRIGE